MDIFLAIEINRPNGAAAGIELDLMNVTVGTNLATASFLGNRNHRGERTGLRFNLASEPETEPAIYASAAAGTGLRENCHWRRKRIEAKLARGAFEQDAICLTR